MLSTSLAMYYAAGFVKWVADRTERAATDLIQDLKEFCTRLGFLEEFVGYLIWKQWIEKEKEKINPMQLNLVPLVITPRKEKAITTFKP